MFVLCLYFKFFLPNHRYLPMISWLSLTFFLLSCEYITVDEDTSTVDAIPAATCLYDLVGTFLEMTFFPLNLVGS